jgi:HTH-type transcriptional regulator/antitoxin HigA
MTKRKLPAEVAPPGEYIRQELEKRGWSQADLAVILGRPIQAVNEIIAAKKAITPETAIELAAAFGTSPDVFLNLENAYRLSLAKTKPTDVSRRAKLYQKVPVRELVKRGWIGASKDIEVLEWEVCEFLEIGSVDEEPRCPFTARKADGYGRFSPAQAAWFYRCRHLADARKPAAPFDEAALRAAAPRLAREFPDQESVERLPERLARLGVLLVVLGHLPGSKIDGAAFWVGRHPVVAVSVRYDRIDSFWHTLLHELAHIVLHGRDFCVVDVDMVGPEAAQEGVKPAAEREADGQACEWLVPQHELAQFIAETKPYYSHHKIVSFAERIGVHPGIVVGQLQHRGEIGWGHSRTFLVKVRDFLPLES